MIHRVPKDIYVRRMFFEAIDEMDGADDVEAVPGPVEAGVGLPSIVALVRGAFVGGSADEVEDRCTFRLLEQELIKISYLSEGGKRAPGSFLLVLNAHVSAARSFKTGVLIRKQ